MAGFSHVEHLSHGPESIDTYLVSLNNLKDKVLTLLDHYQKAIIQKMDCDAGNLVSCNTGAFQAHFADVFTQLNEIEVQLNGLEAWNGLPPECFVIFPNGNQVLSNFPDPDQVSFEAQSLVKAVQELQNGLKMMISHPTEDQVEACKSNADVPNTSKRSLSATMTSESHAISQSCCSTMSPRSDTILSTATVSRNTHAQPFCTASSHIIASNDEGMGTFYDETSEVHYAAATNNSNFSARNKDNSLLYNFPNSSLVSRFSNVDRPQFIDICRGSSSVRSPGMSSHSFGQCGQALSCTLDNSNVSSSYLVSNNPSTLTEHGFYQSSYPLHTDVSESINNNNHVGTGRME